MKSVDLIKKITSLLLFPETRDRLRNQREIKARENALEVKEH